MTGGSKDVGLPGGLQMKRMAKRYFVREKYTAKKVKGTLKQHNVTPIQSHFCEIKLST